MEPKIRFNNNSWQKHKVGELCDLLTGYPFPGDKILNRGKNLLMRGINITEGRIRHSDEIDRYYNEDTIGLEKYRLQVGDLVIGMDGSKVGKNSALVTSKENYSLLVQRVARLRNEDKNLINLIQIAVGSDKFIKYVEEMKTSSAIPHISPADIRNFPLSLPEDSNERRLVASYFTSLDSQISASTSRLASLKQMKAASLQAMFPQEGETVPKIRFKGFEGEWKKVKFGTLLKECTDKSTSEDEDILLSSAINGVFLNSELFGHQRGRSNIGYRKIKRNMLILSAQNLHLGNANVNLRFEHGLVSPAYKIYDLYNVLPEFMYHWIKREETKKFFLDATTAGASLCRKNIVWTDLYKQNILLPKSDTEQQAIASYFTSLDHQISLQSQCLEKLKQIKSACLDKMFV